MSEQQKSGDAGASNVPPADPRVDGSHNGRAADGRFAKGNRLGRGNPLAGRAAKIRAVLLRKLTDREAGRIADKLLEMAKDGDLAAIRELLDRTMGKPSQTEILERIERLEIMLETQNRDA